MSIHQWLATLVIQVEDKNCINIDENGFVANHDFFVSTFAVFEDVDVTVVNIQFPRPLNNKLINSFLLIWIITFKTKNEEAKVSIQFVGYNIDLILFGIKQDRVEVLQVVLIIHVHFDVLLDVDV